MLKCGILGATALMVIGVAAFQLIPQVLLGLFNANADMLAVGDPALRTMSLAFVFAGACIIVGGVFQALGNSVYSMIVSIARQLVVLLPVAYLLSLSGNIDAVWFAFPIAEVASYIKSINRSSGSKTASPNRPVSQIANVRNTIAIPERTLDSASRLPKHSVDFLPRITAAQVSSKMAIVVVLIPPAVPPGEPPINIRIHPNNLDAEVSSA